MQLINGIILVDKPKGLTSNAVLQRVKRLYSAKKAGHTGSLDPLATGMLPICLGEATKWCQYLLDADKCYTVTGCLGIKTNTSDATGEVIAKAAYEHVREEQLRATLTLFTGKISQVPSMFSALKHQGVPLYKFARSGVDIVRQAREISIYSLTLISFDPPFFQLTVNCSKGTYIRNLVEDIGEYLGVGAHVTELHRNYTAGFATADMAKLDTLAVENRVELLARLLPMDQALLQFSALKLSAFDILRLIQGKTITELELPPGLLRLYNTYQQFIGLGEVDNNACLKVKRLLRVD